MESTLKRLWSDEQGQDLTEYALLLTLIALATITAINGLAGAITGIFNNATTSMNT